MPKPAADPQYWARRPFQYFEQNLHRGEVMKMRGGINDEKLIRLGYVAEIPAGSETYECGECGRTFVDQSTRTGHGKNYHTNRSLTPSEEDARADREERMLNEVAPLYLEKTLASQKG